MVACGCPTPRPAEPLTTGPVAVVVAASASSPASSSRLTPVATRELLCAGRKPCALLSERNAGKDGQGRDLRVALLRLDLELFGMKGAGEGELSSSAIPSGVIEEPDGDTFQPVVGHGGCRRFEYWLVAYGSSGPERVRKLVQECNDGNGASGVGEDHVSVLQGVLRVSRYGGSAWRWSEERSYQLEPVRLVQVETSSWFSLGPAFETARWNWDLFAGTTMWFVPTCDANGQPWEGAGDEIGPGPHSTQFEYSPIPWLSLDDAFVNAEWKRADMSRCALSLDASGKNGYVIEGSAGSPADASVLVVAHDKVLFIEVSDDQIRRAGRGAADRVEIWISEPLRSPGGSCAPKERRSLRSWSIRIADGQIAGGEGRPAATVLRVESNRIVPGRVRLKVALPSNENALSVAYADTDDGVSTKRVFATSPLRRDRPYSIGSRAAWGADARCELRDGVLVPVIAIPPVDEPLM